MEETTTSVLEFKGKLTFEKIGILLNDLKNRKELFDIPPVIYKKLLTLMIEVLENVLKYSNNFEDFVKNNPDFYPEFQLTMNDSGFKVLTRNPIRNVDKEIVSGKINRINSANEEELKKYYRETITNGMFTEKGGAGLGLIEMARVTSYNLEYNFSQVKEDFSIFELILFLNHID